VTIPNHLARIPGRTAKTTKEIAFRALDVPALGYKAYYVTKTTFEASPYESKVRDLPHGQDIRVGGEVSYKETMTSQKCHV